MRPHLSKQKGRKAFTSIGSTQNVLISLFSRVRHIRVGQRKSFWISIAKRDSPLFVRTDVGSV
jgi:hypothetical protein